MVEDEITWDSEIYMPLNLRLIIFEYYSKGIQLNMILDELVPFK